MLIFPSSLILIFWFLFWFFISGVVLFSFMVQEKS